MNETPRRAIEAFSALTAGSKRASGDRGDDRIEVAEVDSTAVVALADGAGSARLGGYGAELAVLSAQESVREQLEKVPRPPLESMLAEAMRAARRTLFVVARASATEGEPFEPGDLATTLAVAIVGDEEVGIGSVGDGIQVLRGVDGELALAAMAPDTEIANHADFLTGPDFERTIEVEVVPAAAVESVLLSSDGLDAYLVDRRDGERWPQQASVTALLNAPVLEGWGGPEFEAFLASDLARRYSDDDLSLAVIRRIETPGDGSMEVGGLELTPELPPRPRHRTWRVGGCSSLLALAPDPPLPPSAAILAPEQPILDRGSRYAAVNLPVRRLDQGLVLVPRPPRQARLVGEALRGPDGEERAAILAGVGASVEALHRSGLAHGRLALDSFAVYPDSTVVLWEPGPGMFEAADPGALRSLDRDFLAGLDGGAGHVEAPSSGGGGP